MARQVVSDFLQDSAFWLMDVAPIEPLAIPIFSPLAGFSTISAPELTLETADITEGNYLFRRKVVKRADVGTITLQRGAKFYDSDFNRWVMAALRGSTEGFNIGSLTGAGGIGGIGGPTPRRDLLLIQYFRRTALSTVTTAVTGAALNAALVGTAAALTGEGALGVAGAVASIGLAVSPLGPFEIYPKIPARAWLLTGCLPTRYKTGSDFDAASGQVSIMELDIAPESMEEISLAGT